MAKQHTYITSMGKEFSILPGSPYQIENYRLSFSEQFEAENGARPERPTYKLETMGGGVDIQPHDKTTVKTDEEKAALEAYEGYGERRDHFVNTKILDVLIVENVLADPLADKTWLAKKKFFKVTLPTDEIELKLYYIREHMIFNEEDGGDFNTLPMAIMELSGIGKRAVDAGRASFRRSLRRRNKNTAGTTVVEAGEGVADDTGISGDEDGEGVGENSE
jgi:hypothetical protein